MPSQKAPRSACFTLNNPSDSEIAHLQLCPTDKVRYMVTGFEIGKEGTEHIQGYVETKVQMTMNQMKALLGNRTHFEQRRGTPKQAAGYCKKGGDDPSWFDGKQDYEEFFPRTVEEPESWCEPFETGEISSQGKRTDITAPVEMISEGSTIREVARAFPEQYVKYHKGFRDLRSLMLPPRSLNSLPEVVVLYGPTGTGKTRDAYIKYWPDEPHYVWKPSNGNWWDGYDGEKKIIIDEFRGQMTWSDILGLLDRNQYRAPFKGGFVNIQADKFVITSPFPPDKWYKDDDRYDRFLQLERRITTVIEYKGPLSTYVIP